MKTTGDGDGDLPPSRGAGDELSTACKDSASTKGRVSTENARASSSAYTSKRRGRLSNPSAARWMIGVGNSENVGMCNNFPVSRLLSADHPEYVGYVERCWRRGDSKVSCRTR